MRIHENPWNSSRKRFRSHLFKVEVGLYVGYSSTRMASQMRRWGGRVISMEVDPYHAAIARNTIEWAGLSDYIEIWCGHSENLIPRLKERLPEKSIDILFFDQQGTKMHLDLQRIVDFNMLSDNAIVVGDNVLRPGAPQFMYWNTVAGPYETQVVSLREYKQARKPRSQAFHILLCYLLLDGIVI